MARRNSAASGPSRSRQRSRSPALPACSKPSAAAPRRAAPTACAAPLSRCAAAARPARSAARHAASIACSDSMALSRNFCQQFLDAGAVVAEPGGQHAAVDRGAGARGWRRRAVANRQPALEGGAQPVDRHRLCQIGVHAGGEAALLFAAHRIGRHRDDRRARAAVLGLRRAQPARQLVAVHARHVQIGEHRRIAPGRPCRQRLAAVLGGIGGEAEEPQLAHQHIAIDRMVVDHQQPRRCAAGASQPSPPEIGGRGKGDGGLQQCRRAATRPVPLRGPRSR